MRNEMKSASGDGGAEKKKLFKKSMDELREAFVRARFAQEDVFGRADIEEWLEGQRESEKPEYINGGLSDGESYWNTVFAHHLFTRAIPNSLAVLGDCATHLSGPPHNHPLFGSQNQFTSFIMMLYYHLKAWKMYFGYCDKVIIHMEPGGLFSGAVESGKQERLVFELLAEDSIKTSIFVLDVLFAEWLYRRPKWDRARQFLCDALADEIAKERAKAEDDFNRAVAVSADGTKIVCADEVVVIDGNKRMTVFPAEAFMVNKILRVPEMERSTITLASLLHRWQNLPHAFVSQLFVNCYGIFDSKTRLVTQTEFCPDPLPEGGVELKI